MSNFVRADQTDLTDFKKRLAKLEKRLAKCDGRSSAQAEKVT